MGWMGAIRRGTLALVDHHGTYTEEKERVRREMQVGKKERKHRCRNHPLVECIIDERVAEDVILTNDIIIYIALNVLDWIRVGRLAPRLTE